MYKLWKKGFDKWESATAEYLEELLESPAVLKPSGKMLEAAMKTKSSLDEAAKKWWSAWGLPTKHDQERTLHQINRLESRLLDLEEELRRAKAEAGESADGTE